MPIRTDDELKEMLADGQITAITLDTNIFDAQQLNLKSPALKALAALKELPFRFLLSSTVRREVQRHIEKQTEDAHRAVKRATGKALYAFDTAKPTRDELLDLITGGSSPAEAAAKRLNAFLEDSGCEVLEDASLADVASLFDAYFCSYPPFSRAKKAEFPDALALHALSQAASRCDTGFLVVSDDGDWREFCARSPQLYPIPKIEKALSLINNTPAALRKAVVGWIINSTSGRAEIEREVSHLVERRDVDAAASANYGEVETTAWAPTVRMIDWPDKEEIDIIETETLEDGSLEVVASLPLTVSVGILVELDFSIWDSIDKEAVSMGGRSVELDRDEEVQVTVNLIVESVGEADESIKLVQTEIDVDHLTVDLGSVDMFEDEDYEEP